MYVLAIDTVTEMCSVALSVDGELMEREDKAVNRHSNIVLGMINELLAEAEISLTQLDLIVNDVGPGSFTGIRIGMGVAQGLAYGADLPVLGVDALSTLARGVKDNSKDDILAAIDARMGQVYWAQYLHRSGSLYLKDQLHLSDPGQINMPDQRVYGAGSGWDEYADVLGSQFAVSGYAPNCFPLARHGLECGLQLEKSEWVSAGDLLPVYLRNDVAKVSRKSPSKA
jgi:tRNA threonylcarbamoyladenosine biosynthesis protein TsaB